MSASISSKQSQGARVQGGGMDATAGVPSPGGGPQERRSSPGQGKQEGSAHRLRGEVGASAGSPART